MPSSPTWNRLDLNPYHPHPHPHPQVHLCHCCGLLSLWIAAPIRGASQHLTHMCLGSHLASDGLGGLEHGEHSPPTGWPQTS